MDTRHFDHIKMLDSLPLSYIRWKPNCWIYYFALYMERDGCVHPSKLYTSVRKVTKKVVHTNLNRMVAAGAVKKNGVAQGSRRVSYELTELGRSYLPVIKKDIEWHYAHYAEVIKSLESCKSGKKH